MNHSCHPNAKAFKRDEVIVISNLWSCSVIISMPCKILLMIPFALQENLQTLRIHFSSLFANPTHPPPKKVNSTRSCLILFKTNNLLHDGWVFIHIEKPSSFFITQYPTQGPTNSEDQFYRPKGGTWLSSFYIRLQIHHSEKDRLCFGFGQYMFTYQQCARMNDIYLKYNNHDLPITYIGTFASF